MGLSRFILPFVLCGATAFPAGLAAQSQDDNGTAALLSAARGEIARLRDAIAALEVAVRREEDQVASSISDGQTQADVLRQITLAEEVVGRHPLLPGFTSACQDALTNLSKPGAEAIAARCLEEAPIRVEMSSRYGCSSLTWVSDERDRIWLEGYVGEEVDMADLRARFGELTVARVALRPFPVCAALDALALPMTSGDLPALRMLNRQSTIQYGESLAFEVRTPNFPAFLYVAYLSADGAVVNLTPRRGPLREQRAPNSILRFGDGQDGRRTFTASAPPGPEAIVAIAARSPIEELEAIEVGAAGQYWANGRENTTLIGRDNFIALLDKGLSDAPDDLQAGREVSANLIHIEVVAN